MKTIAFFNNKGGVGKTPLAYHLAWMLSNQNFTVVAADLDPQANLTSMFLSEEELDKLWNDNTEVANPKTIHHAINQLRRGLGDVLPLTAFPIQDSERLYLLPGDLALSDFESDLAEQWPKCLDRDERAFRVTTAFSRIIQQAGSSVSADLAIIDVGPNLGAINRTALIASDYVAIPLGPDIFSLQGLRNMGPRLRQWRRDWGERIQKNPAADIQLPSGQMKPLGYIMMRHNIRKERPAKWYGKWIARMPEAFLQDILDDKLTNPPPVDSDKNCLGQMKDYKSLMPMAQEANKPMFLLKPGDGAIGGHQSAVLNCYHDFKALASEIAERSSLLLRTQESVTEPAIRW